MSSVCICSEHSCVALCACGQALKRHVYVCVNKSSLCLCVCVCVMDVCLSLFVKRCVWLLNSDLSMLSTAAVVGKLNQARLFLHCARRHHLN